MRALPCVGQVSQPARLGGTSGMRAGPSANRRIAEAFSSSNSSIFRFAQRISCQEFIEPRMKPSAAFPPDQRNRTGVNRGNEKRRPIEASVHSCSNLADSHGYRRQSVTIALIQRPSLRLNFRHVLVRQGPPVYLFKVDWRHRPTPVGKRG